MTPPSGPPSPTWPTVPTCESAAVFRIPPNADPEDGTDGKAGWKFTNSTRPCPAYGLHACPTPWSGRSGVNTHKGESEVEVVRIATVADSGIHGGDGPHIILVQDEVEDPGVLLDPLLVGGLGDDDQTPLNVPAENDLGRGPIDLPADGLEPGIGQDGSARAAQRAVGLDIHPEFPVAVVDQLLVDELG